MLKKTNNPPLAIMEMFLDCLQRLCFVKELSIDTLIPNLEKNIDLESVLWKKLANDLLLESDIQKIGRA